MSDYIDKLNLSGQELPIRDSSAQDRINELNAAQKSVKSVLGTVIPVWESGGMYSATGIEYASGAHIRTGFIPVTPGETYRFDWTIQKPLNIYGFAADTRTSSGVNQRTAYKATPYANQPLYYTVPANVNYIRLQIEGTLTHDKPTMVNLGGSILLDLAGRIIDADITADTKASYFDDADNAPVNSVYSVSSTAEMAHTPYGPGVASNGETHYTNDLYSLTGYQSGILYTYKSGVMINQIFLSATKKSGAASDPAVLWYRCKWSAGAWSDWHAAGDQVALSASNIIIVNKMIAPYKVDGVYTATLPGGADPDDYANTQYMGDDPRIFNDFNNAPINKMYQIDLNCTAELMANNPMPGKSSVLCTFGFGYASSHGRFQLCVGLNYPNAFAFIRYGYYQSADAGFVWTPWASLTGGTAQQETFGIQTRLTNGADLNAVKDSGVYLLGTNGGYTNAPSGLSYGFLTVKTVNVITCQTVETPAGNFARFFDGSAWGEWSAR